MKKTTTSIIIILATIFVISAKLPGPTIKENLTTLILVRHAEKVPDNSSDPVLTDKGKKRAQELAYILAHIPIDLIYSTPYKRTKATVAPVAKNKNLTLNSYIPMHELDFLTEILKLHIVQPLIDASSFHKFLMGSHVDNFTLVQHRYFGSVFYGAQPVRYDKNGPSLHKTVYGLLYVSF